MYDGLIRCFGFFTTKDFALEEESRGQRGQRSQGGRRTHSLCPKEEAEALFQDLFWAVHVPNRHHAHLPIHVFYRRRNQQPMGIHRAIEKRTRSRVDDVNQSLERSKQGDLWRSRCMVLDVRRSVFKEQRVWNLSETKPSSRSRIRGFEHASISRKQTRIHWPIDENHQMVSDKVGKRTREWRDDFEWKGLFLSQFLQLESSRELVEVEDRKEDESSRSILWSRNFDR